MVTVQTDDGEGGGAGDSRGEVNGRSFVEMAVGKVSIGSMGSLSADETKSVCMPVYIVDPNGSIGLRVKELVLLFEKVTRRHSLCR